jgi:hypothetical protein
MIHSIQLTNIRGEPDGRGTFGILQSCVITLSLCVYTALHLNIFPKKFSQTQILLSQAAWITVGIFAPELVVFVAFQQYQAAKKLKNEMNDILHDKVRHMMPLQVRQESNPVLTILGQGEGRK